MTDRSLLDGVVKGAEGESPIKLLSPFASSAAGNSLRLGFSATPAENQTLLAKSPLCRTSQRRR